MVLEPFFFNFHLGCIFPLFFFFFFFQTQKVSSSPSYDIHYWIGSRSTQDEQGAAAVYAIQLDEFLGCAPVQHREAQGHESDAFRGYFKQGIIYKKGGVASGMRHAETNAYDVRRLLQVKGKKRAVAAEVRRRVERWRGFERTERELCVPPVLQVEMSWMSFNLGDVFLMDIGKTIVQWNGPKSNRQERLKVRAEIKEIKEVKEVRWTISLLQSSFHRVDAWLFSGDSH